MKNSLFLFCFILTVSIPAISQANVLDIDVKGVVRYELEELKRGAIRQEVERVLGV